LSGKDDEGGSVVIHLSFMKHPIACGPSVATRTLAKLS
jgi:hypothetical protein